MPEIASAKSPDDVLNSNKKAISSVVLLWFTPEAASCSATAPGRDDYSILIFGNRETEIGTQQVMIVAVGAVHSQDTESVSGSVFADG